MKSGTTSGTTLPAFLSGVRYHLGYRACRPRKTGTGTTGYHLSGQRGWWVPPYRGTTPAPASPPSQTLTNPKYLRYCGTVGHSAQTRADALDALRNGQTIAEVHRATSIPKSTLSGWATDEGIDVERSTDKTRAATEARRAVTDAQRQAFAADLLEDVGRLRGELFAPCVEKRAVVVSQGRDDGSVVEVVEIERDQPTFSEQTKIMTSIAIGVDKLQLLTGQATHIDGVAPERNPDQEREAAEVLHLVRTDAA